MHIKKQLCWNNCGVGIFIPTLIFENITFYSLSCHIWHVLPKNVSKIYHRLYIKNRRETEFMLWNVNDKLIKTRHGITKIQVRHPYTSMYE